MNVVTALLWERRQRIRWAVTAAVAAPFIGWLIGTAGYIMVGGHVARSLWFTGTILLAAALLFGQCEMQSLNLGFPKRLFRYPVRTATLLAVTMSFGVVAIGLPFLSILAYGWLFEGSVEGFWTVFLMVETGFVWLQTLAWLNGAGAVFIFLLPSLIGGLTLLYLAANYLQSLDVNIICPAVIVLCCGISFWNLSADRRGSWISSRPWVDFLAGLFRRSRTKDFTSALNAQTWFETRQTGYLYPVAALGLVGAVLCARIAAVISSSDIPPPALIPYNSIPEILRMIEVSAWLGGALSFAVYHRDRASGALSFRLRRPVSTQTLAVAQLKTPARSLVITLGIITVIISALFLRDWSIGAQTGMASFIPQALKGGTIIEITLTAVPALFGLALFCWSVMQLPRETVLVIIALNLGHVMVWIYFGGDVVRTDKFLASDPVRQIGSIVAFGLMIVTLRIINTARRRKLISTKTLVYIACAFPAAAASLSAFAMWIGIINGWPSLLESVYILSAAGVPFIPLATVPLSIAKRRHH